MERQYKPIEPKSINKKLIVLWSIYALIVYGLACFALWTGDWKWNAEVMIFSWPLLFIVPTLALTAFFRTISKVVKGEKVEWVVKTGCNCVCSEDLYDITNEYLQYIILKNAAKGKFPTWRL